MNGGAGGSLRHVCKTLDKSDFLMRCGLRFPHLIPRKSHGGAQLEFDPTIILGTMDNLLDLVALSRR